MWRRTRVSKQLGIRLPIVGAPMAGGPTTPALVAAVSSAGGLGVLDGAYRTPDGLRDAIAEVRRRTDAPFGVNLLVPPDETVVDDAEIDRALETFAPYAAEVGVSLARPRGYFEPFADALEVVIAARVPFFSFTFGIPPTGALEAFRAAGTLSCGTATSVAEARALVDVGVDAVCVQAAEGGGHRGGFLGDPTDSAVGLVALVPLVCDAVTVPVIAAGGIMDGRSVAAAFCLGADAVQLGTAFLLAPEAGTSEPYRKSVLTAAETDTMLTPAFSGRPARGIRNRLATELAGQQLPPYPVTNAITRELRKAAAAQGRSEFLSLWAGQGVPLAREDAAAEVVARLERETDAVLRRVSDEALG